MLDSGSPSGEEAIAHQREVQDLISSMGYVVTEMPNPTCPYDILISKRSGSGLVLSGIAEIKSRTRAGNKDLTIDYLNNEGGYLISMDKIESGRKASKYLGVPFFIIVKLVSTGDVVCWKVTDADGSLIEEVSGRVSQTRATVNGGVANRENAFLSTNSKNFFILEQGTRS